MGGGLLPKIAWTNAVIIVALLMVAAVALVTNNKDVGNLIVGSVIGVAFGAGATTVVVQQHVSGKSDSTKQDSTGT